MQTQPSNLVFPQSLVLCKPLHSLSGFINHGWFYVLFRLKWQKNLIKTCQRNASQNTVESTQSVIAIFQPKPFINMNFLHIPVHNSRYPIRQPDDDSYRYSATSSADECGEQAAVTFARI